MAKHNFIPSMIRRKLIHTQTKSHTLVENTLLQLMYYIQEHLFYYLKQPYNIHNRNIYGLHVSQRHIQNLTPF